MAEYKYGSWVGAQETGKVTHRAYLYYTKTTDNETTYKLSVGSGVDPWNSKWIGVTTVFGLTGRTSRTYSVTSSDGSLWRAFADQTFTYTKGHSAVTKTISATTKTTSVDSSAGGASVNGKTSTASYTFTVPAKAHYTVSYYSNGGSGAPSSQTKWYGETLTLSSTKPTRTNYYFRGWATTSSRASSGYVDYSSGSSYTGNKALTLYAVWSAVKPPTCTAKLKTTKIRAGFDAVTINISNIVKDSGRSISSIVVNCNGHTKSGTTTGDYTIAKTSFTTSDVGTRTVKVTITDNGGLSTTYSNIGSVSIISPTWTKTVQINDVLPTKDKNGNAVISSLQVWNYSTGAYQSLSNTGYKLTKVSNTSWKITVTLNANQVPSKTTASQSLSSHPIKVSYNHYETTATEQNSAFYETTRNQNYSNGIYNVMFVSGCNSENFPNYRSRVWWSKYNDPLYFPDTNYSEVGSNDTAVQGLTKVGDYLGVVKQSKTTDTAIYLLYPTSFEEDTTFAVKQGVQGVGALSKYSFNILGDETLFLSPQGVMAIVPTQDEEHKVQNRSYFVDKRLLGEPTIANSYSFVYDGKYYLSVNNEHGSVYVLDGNQRNSWGNDRTNLVYECYYLENVPAKCFVKFNDTLVFSNDDDVCVFGTDFVDAYDMSTDEENVPVKAEWSTIFDDDNALHYYKTMQKKGNLVSVLPTDYVYKVVEITEEMFNEDPTLYYVLVDDNFVNCTDESEYSEEETYYIMGKSSTQVFVRKDDKEPIEIERTFGDASNIPSEMFLNKKFKKYKRLQFIIRNDEAEDFGVDSIIKNYTVGNYAKR